MQVQYMADGDREYWGRGCLRNCMNDVEEGIWCCNGDMCNGYAGAGALAPTLAFALVPALLCWLNA